MSDCEWDADDFEPAAAEVKSDVVDKWDGEDEEGDVKDNWDDEEKEEGEEGAEKAVQVKKKKGLQARLAEKEALKKKLEQERREQAEAARVAEENMTPEERSEEHLRRKQAQEDADLEMARLTFGDEPEKAGEIDGFQPITEDSFTKFRTLLTEKISKFDKSPHYVSFIELLARDLCLGVDPEEIKKIANSLTTVANEKIKLTKPAKKKNKKGKATMSVGKDNTLDAFQDHDDMYDDFI